MPATASPCPTPRAPARLAGGPVGAAARRRRRDSRVGARVAGVVLHGLPDFLALRTDGELLRRPAGHPDLAAQGHDRGAHHHRLGELVLVDEVGEPLVVTLVRGDGPLLVADVGVDGGLRAEPDAAHQRNTTWDVALS